MCFRLKNSRYGIILSMGIGACHSTHPLNAFEIPSNYYSILSYDVEIEPDFQKQSLHGKTRIIINKKGSDANALEFPLYGLQIDKVLVDGKTAKSSLENNRLRVEISPTQNERPVLEVSYSGRPTKGLVFGDDYVYTNFDTCGWMLCNEEPGRRATFKINLRLPLGYTAVSNGSLRATKNVGSTLKEEIWEETEPYPPYLFGFAVGKFTEASENYGAVKLRYLGHQEDSASLLKKFKITKEVIAFFEDKAGIPFPHTTYTQVLLPLNEAQEKDGFALLGKAYVDPILEDPTEDWAIVHELSHQWWGNLMTCSEWKHFWLNEGLTVFMTAAYKEKKWGTKYYQREIELAEKRYQVAKDQNFDVPLTYGGSYPSLQIKRAISYSKGMLFIVALRRDIGEVAFWSGLKIYSQAHILKSVTSQEFQDSMEKAAGHSLDNIFNKWVY